MQGLLGHPSPETTKKIESTKKFYAHYTTHHLRFKFNPHHLIPGPNT